MTQCRGPAARIENLTVFGSRQAASQRELNGVMSRMVMCKKYKKELEGLAQPPYPGAKGQEIFENVSKQAWQEWLEHQTRLINEKHLNMMDPSARSYLSEQMDKFFAGDAFDQAEGYVPTSK